MAHIPHIGSQGSRSLPWLTGAAVALATALWWRFGAVPADLVFDRSAIADGEAWRLVTGHLVHSDARHASWDIGALAVVGMLAEERGRMRLLKSIAVGIVAVDLALWWCLPQLDYYCGLSGVLNTVCVVAVADLWTVHRHPVFLVGALGLAVKLLLEVTAEHSLLVGTTWPGVPLTHLAGALGGVVLLWSAGGGRRTVQVSDMVKQGARARQTKP